MTAIDMESPPNDLEIRVTCFAEKHGLTISGGLGAGFDGSVFVTSRHSAIKVFRFDRLYQRERDVYQRLQQNDVTIVMGFQVPQLLNFDDELLVVEMTIVKPPFVLDFAGAYLDQRPDYPEEVLEEWRAEKAEQFGDGWPIVRLIMSTFAGLGIYLADVKPGNIEFAPPWDNRPA